MDHFTWKIFGVGFKRLHVVCIVVFRVFLFIDSFRRFHRTLLLGVDFESFSAYLQLRIHTECRLHGRIYLNINELLLVEDSSDDWRGAKKNIESVRLLQYHVSQLEN